MRHHDTVFRQLTKWIDWREFDSIVARHGGDRGVRRLRCRDQLGAMLYVQLSGARSLREVEAGPAGHAGRLHHCGFRPVARATLGDANAARPAAIFAELFAAMAARAGRRLRRATRQVRILDATRIALSPACRGWAAGPNGASAAKLHLVWDPDAGVPLTAEMTGPRVNDITPAKAAEIVPGATYVFDLGYYSFDWWGALDARGCTFVTRLKCHTGLHDVIEGPRPDAPGLIAERTGTLPPKHARDLRKRLREIELRLNTGKRLRLVTNDLDSPAEAIAALYKTRWQIELAFKWIKQHLRIRAFLGTSPNAVRIQLYTALIAYLIIRLAHAAQSAVQQAKIFLNLVSRSLMHRRPVTTLNKPNPPPPKNTRQPELDLSP